MKQQILALLAAGKTYKEIVAELGCAKSTISYHAKSVNSPPNYKVHNWAEVQRYYDAGNGVNQCRRHFGICTTAWYNAIRDGKVVTRKDYRIPIEVLTAQQRNTARSHLRWRLIGDGLLDCRCAACGITEWLNQPLSLHLHHINGVRNDNCLDNLQLLCPNCHSQTKTYSGRNNKK